MKIFLIYKEDYPWDVRVEKLALALSEFGHSVTIISNNHKQNQSESLQGDIAIRRLPNIKWLPSKLIKLAFLPAWFNPIWLISILRYSKGSDSPLFIIRDLPLIRTGILCARLRQGKVMLDMAEVYPEMYASSRQFSRKNSLEKLAKHPALAERYESRTLPRVDHTLVMIEESRNRLLGKGMSPEKVTIVSNTPPQNKYNSQVHEHEGHQIRLVYVGFLTRLRGLDLLIQGVKQFIELGYDKSDIRVDIVGKGAARQELIDLVATLDVGECVKIHGWLEQEDVDRLLGNANVGALTYRVCGHWNHTIPNKIFDYMLAGLPVLTTPVIPIRRIIQEADCGLVCEGDDISKAIALNLEKLRDPSLRELLGRKGFSAIQEQYNWEQDKAKLEQVVRDLASEQPASSARQSAQRSTSQ
ncbi:glycosyltransferase family 4 protein [Marinobacter sp. JSM 1782161]|uniref:glycosyltransferase family 4 protein n=1 Tax=Marinobacter sp. JSM 1782161 TaxID=2685906 RepID=UPI001402C0D9|nr:glycosyltransferase family 4 protein [Marinobacter sp. JSM 1782161]